MYFKEPEFVQPLKVMLGFNPADSARAAAHRY
jgi:hypothetical protein